MLASCGYVSATPVMLKSDKKGLYLIAVYTNLIPVDEFAISSIPSKIDGKIVRPATVAH